MLPVSSTTTNSSCHTQIPIHGALKPFSPFDVNGNSVDKMARNFCNGLPLDRVSLTESFKRRSASCFYSNYAVNGEQCGSMDMINRSVHQIGLSSSKHFERSGYELAVVDESQQRLGPNSLVFADSFSSSVAIDHLSELPSVTVDNAVEIPSYADPEFTTPLYGVPSDPSPVPNSGLSYPKTNIAEMSQSFADSINSGQNILDSSVENITSSVNATLTSTTKAVDNVINDIVSFFNKSGESFGNKFTQAIGGLKEVPVKGGLTALDVLRKVVYIVEDSLSQGAKSVGYAYTFAKESLPPEFRGTVSLSEESAVKVLGPIGTAFQLVYAAVEGLEKSLGLDPNDPLVPFVLFLGFSATLWGSYRVFIYGGYAGDLSPKSTLELLRGNENVVLIDIRPENLKEKDGIPDLRRTSRSRYTSITVPEVVDNSVKKLLKGGRDVEDLMLSAIIRNLKIVKDKTTVLVMDADGTRSKGVARSLKKLGTKKSYLVQGGFRSWVNEGCRVKELKPETTLTILNEEAEAILEEINPTPLKVFGYSLVFLAAVYSLIEWEKTLQFIAVIGLGQTILSRVGSYQSAEDVKKDIGILLTPARLGNEAISWAAGKLETSRNGLPTSPSSSDVQSRVLQAAAKHESQPEETQDLSSSMTASDVNISKA